MKAQNSHLVQTCLLAIAVIVAAPGIAGAATLTLSPVVSAPFYQQTSNSPCVIGDPSCSAGDLPGKTVLPPGASSYDALSPVYTVADIRAAVGDTFFVGFDVNQTNVDQTLSLFQMLIDGGVIDEYRDDDGTPVPPTSGGGNGTGWADYLFTGFTSLAAYDATSTVQFRAVMPIANDGREQFFLISTGDPGSDDPPAPIPEPATTALMGIGLLGLGLMSRRFQKNR